MSYAKLSSNLNRILEQNLDVQKQLKKELLEAIEEFAACLGCNNQAAYCKDCTQEKEQIADSTGFDRGRASVRTEGE